MKKANYFIFGLIVLFVHFMFASNSLASTTADYSVTDSQPTGKEFVVMGANFSDISELTVVYAKDTKTGDYFNAYCRTPLLGIGGTYTGDLITINSANTEYNIFNAGIIEIIRSQGDSGKDIPNKLKESSCGNFSCNASLTASEVQATNATDMALRFYEALMNMINVKSPGADYSASYNERIDAYRCYAKKLVNNDSFKDVIKDLGIKESDIECSNINRSLSFYDNFSKDETKIKSQLLSGLKAALNLKNGKVEDLNMATISKIDKSKTDLEILESDPTKGIKTIYYVIHTSGFSSDGVINASLDCPECSKYGSIDYYVLKDGEYVEYSDSTNLLNYALSNGTIKIKADIIIDNIDSYTKTDCPTVNYSLNVKYSDQTIRLQVYKINVASEYSQDFYINYYVPDATYELNEDDLKNNDGETSFKLCGSFNEGCEDWKQQCLNGNTKSCDKYHDESNKCIICGAYLGNNECSVESKAISIVEGVEYDNEGNSKGRNVVGCVIGTKDVAEEPYLASDNKYCKVYCKEEYKLNMPGKDLKAEEFMTIALDVGITGTKTCYTTRINYEQYEIDRTMGVSNATTEMNKCLNPDFSYEMEPVLTAWFKDDSQSMVRVSLDPNKPVKNSYSELTSDSYDGTKATVASDVRFVKMSQTITSVYLLESEYCAVDPTFATAKFFGPSGERVKNCSTLEHAHPVDSEGKLEYSIAMENLGDYYSKNVKGRIWGSDKSVVTVLANSNTLEKGIIKKTDNSDKGVYVCEYFVGDEEYYCKDSEGNIHPKSQCEEGEDWLDCQKRLCPSPPPQEPFCKEENGKTHSKSECKKDETEANCELRVCHPVGCDKVGDKYYYNREEISYEKYRDFYKCADEKGCEIIDGEYYYNEQKISYEDYIDVYKCDNTPHEEDPCYKDEEGRYYVNGVPATYKQYLEAGCCEDCPPGGGGYIPKCEIYKGKFYGPSGERLKSEVEMRQKCEPCPSCPPTGKGSITKRIKYRSITTSNVNPNERQLGANWSYDETEVSTALELKAYATTKEIEENSEEVYDVDFDNKTNNTTVAVKVKLDSKMINYLKKYNKDHKKDGYLNNTLSCYDMENNNNGGDKKTYENIYCYSEVIDNLIDKYPNNIDFSVNRPRSESERKNTQNSNYFTSWSKADSSNWTIVTERGLAYYKNNYTKIGIGPSWK